MDTQTTAPQTPADRAGTVGNETKQATKDVAATAGQEAQRVTREAKDQVRQLVGQTRSDLQSQAATQQSRAATGLRELSDQLRTMANSTDQDGMARGLVDDAARRAGDAASWLDQRDPGSILDEVRTFAQRRPGAFLAIAAGVGVVAGRLSRSLVDEARDESSASRTTGYGSTGQGYVGSQGYAGGQGYAGSEGYQTSAGGYGTGSLAGTGVSDAGMPSATSPTTGSTSSLPVTPGGSQSAVEAGMATVPSGDLPGPHRTTQPMGPDGTPTPISSEGHLSAEDDDPIARGER
ncbi:MAG: hypothetical protein K0R30_2663 [Ornithinibacter sp.]|jgi:hypothetical protein|nr:hypothetical protein [Ornithinibacter sp.]